MQRPIILSVAYLVVLFAQADDRTLVRGEYWFDEQSHTSMSVSKGENNLIIDASALSEGLHRLNYRVLDSEGYWSALHTWMFFRYVPENVGACTLEYWIDEGSHQQRNISESETTFKVDASLLAEGLHTLNYRTNTNNGNGALQTWTFYKVSTSTKATSLKWYRIWWNDHEDKAVKVQLPNGTSEYLYEETLAVPEYARGDAYSHNSKARFHLVFCDDQGQLSPVESAEVPYPDIYPPYTTLTASLQVDSVSLSWMANKDNVRDYNVYYSENGEPYVLWISNTTQQEAVFHGQKGKAYRFLVTARDDKGNYEAMEESKAAKVEFK